MENENLEQEAKRKFAFLLCLLAEEGFRFEYIESKIIRDPFFLFFERNEVPSFLEKPIEDIVKEIFHKQVYIDYGKPLPAELFWAAGMYVSLLLNLGVPLQRSFLVFPIIKMLSLFDPYHEMNDSALLGRYREEEKKTSVLRLLIRQQISIRKLSSLLRIPEPTLLSYLDNEKLFSMSLENGRKIADFFGVPLAAIGRESLFCPKIDAFLRVESFKEWFVALLISYWNLDEKKVKVAESFVNGEGFDCPSFSGEVLVDPYHFVLVRKKNNRTVFTELNEAEIRFLSKQAIRHLKESLPTGQLLF